MAKNSKQLTSEELRQRLIALLVDFEEHLQRDDLRLQVTNLIPAHRLLRDLGGSLIPGGLVVSARARILAYFRRFPGEVIDGDELMVVSGISEYARRVRELRVQEGWPILSGHTSRDLRATLGEEGLFAEELPPAMKPDQYLLQEDRQDREGAHRWHMANQIRRSRASVHDKLLSFFRANVGQHITSDELRYLAGDRSEWARRTRELRTEDGWPIVTRYNGDPTLPVGVYILARDEQAPAHDRHIPEITRREVMKRDNWSCRWVGCGWPVGYPDSDVRYLEAHHIVHHQDKGSNDTENLVTLCNLHHDETHRTGELNITQAA